ncbi:MAG TPA: beta-glucosidase BglX [Bryobacteraceae bacterium]|jgi:beta-glucosidase|nr:beta-glucosidase BglX [Bryobacteraceae bacterium]
MRRIFAFALFVTQASFLVTRLDAQYTDQQVDKRVNALLGRMTLEEKIGQLTQIFYMIPDGVKPEERIRKGQVGSFLFVTDPAVVNRLQHVAMEESRLRIPLLIGFDVVHGFHTIFPVPLAMAATWDPILVTRAQAAAAREADAAGTKWAFAPMVDIARDPRWGRIVEGAGEDPFLGSVMAKAQVSGFQGPYLGSPGHVLACVKHFAGYGAAEGGRDYDSVYLSESSLRNVYLPPFRAAVDAGVGCVMSAYMDLNDVPATGNRFLLRDILRQEWGFQGFVVSDAFSISDLVTHGFASDPADATWRAFSAGVDMDMGSNTYLQNLPRLVETGRVSRDAVDKAVRLLLAAKVRLGLFEHPYIDESQTKVVFADRASRTLARTAAARSAVLLRNENHLLPLSKTVASVAVIGPLANSQSDIEGPWSLAGDRAHAVTVLDGIRNKLGAAAKVEYARGGELRRVFPSFFDALFPAPKETPLTPAQATGEISDAVSLAAASDVAVLVLGETQKMSGEGASVSSLDLPGRQQELLKAVVNTGKPVVLVLITGRPLDISWAAEHVPAILEAWFPGTEGGNAIADLLFGDENPGGKLPVTWPRSTGQVPIYYAHNLTHQPDTGKGFTSRYWDLPSSPLYPFGYGLSYTDFSFSNLKLAQTEVFPGQTLYVSVDVQNTGSRTGSEVAQLYIHQRSGSTSRPVRLLKDFERVTLTPGEKKTVHFSLGKDELSFWSSAENKWVEEKATFDLWTGADSNAPLHAEFSVRE